YLNGVLLIGCDDSSYNPQAEVNDKQIRVPLPESISAMAFTQENLRVEVWITDPLGNTQTFPLAITNVDNNEVRGNIHQTFEPGDYSLRLIYNVSDANFGIVELMELGEVDIEVTADGNSIADFSETPATYPDSDDDGFTNIDEVKTATRTDPFDGLVFPGHTIAPPHNPKVTIKSGIVSYAGLRHEIQLDWELSNPSSVESSFNVYMDPNPGITQSTRGNVQIIETNVIPRYTYPLTIADNQPFYIAITHVQGVESHEAAELFVQGRDFGNVGIISWITAEAREGEIAVSWATIVEDPLLSRNIFTLYWSDSPELSERSIFVRQNIVPGAEQTLSSSVVHGNLKNGHTYYYYVATSDSTRTYNSSIVGATPYGRLAPPVVGEINVSPLVISDAGLAATISWTSNPGAVAATVYFSSDPNVNKDNYPDHPDGQRFTTTTNQLDITNLQAGLAYYLRIVFTDRYGRDSDQSEVVSYTPR
ncbi:MAG: hypothetical protein AMJ53_14335, partial [Gammaproteobacteria bacterium SG8_11]